MVTLPALLAAATLAATVPPANGPEVEVGGGAAFGSAAAPMLSVRAGWEFFQHLTVSARYVGLDQPPTLQNQGGNVFASTAYQAWGTMAEVNLHTAGDVQVGLALDFGVGKANMEYPGGLERGSVAPCGQVSITARLDLPYRLFLVLEIGANVWSGLAVTDAISGQTSTGHVDNGFLTLANLGWRIP